MTPDPSGNRGLDGQRPSGLVAQMKGDGERRALIERRCEIAARFRLR